VVRPDAHPRANASVVPSLRASMLSRGGTRARMSPGVNRFSSSSSSSSMGLSDPAGGNGADLIEARDIAGGDKRGVALDVSSRSGFGKGVGLHASPFTPRYPSRLRITGQSPLRGGRPSSSASSLSSPLSSPTSSTNSLSRAGANSFDSSTPTSPASHQNIVVEHKKLRLMYSPSTPHSIEESAAESSWNSMSKSKKKDGLPSDFPVGRIDLNSNTDVSARGSNTSARVTVAPASAVATAAAVPAITTTLRTTTTSERIRDRGLGIYSHGDEALAPQATAKHAASFEWRSFMTPLGASSTRADWQFNTNGKPAVLSQAVLQRSCGIAECVQLYSGDLDLFASRYTKAIAFLSERASRVDRAHAQAVAASMVDARPCKRELLQGRLRVEISEAQVCLERLRAECQALQGVQNQQLALIKKLEHGSV
jgi:hypothetical protein